MIVRWPRNNFIQFVFVTAVTATTGIHEVQPTPSHTLQYRHVTPASAITGIKTHYLIGGYSLQFKHVTPGAYVPPTIPDNQLVIQTVYGLVQPLVVELHSDNQKRKYYD